MRHGDLKNFRMTHQHIEARNYFPKKTRNPHGTPLHVLFCGTLGFRGTPTRFTFKSNHTTKLNE